MPSLDLALSSKSTPGSMMPRPHRAVAPALLAAVLALLVGCPDALRPPETWDPDALGAAWVILGDADTAALGTDLAVTDWNRDGRLDLVASAPGPPGCDRCEGRVFLYLNGEDGLPVTPSAVTTDAEPGGGFGRALDVGDVDGDGLPDLLASRGAGGGVAVIAGRGDAGFGDTLAVLEAPRGWALGARALRLVDLGAGLELVAVGAVPGRGGDHRLLGTVHAWSMPDGARHRILLGPEAGLPLLGLAILGTGDFDGDGAPDLALGAGSAGLPQTANGAIFVLRGDGRPALPTHTGPGDSRLGSSGVVLGDLDGDGLVELAAGSPYGHRGGHEDGYVAILGVDPADRALRPRWESPSGNDWTGHGRALAAGCTDASGAILLADSRGLPAVQNSDGTVIEVLRVGAGLVPEPVAEARLPTREWSFGPAMDLAPLGPGARCTLVVGMPAFRGKDGVVGALAAFPIASSAAQPGVTTPREP